MDKNFIPFALGLTPINFEIVEVLLSDNTIILCLFREELMAFNPWDEIEKGFIFSIIISENIKSWRKVEDL